MSSTETGRAIAAWDRRLPLELLGAGYDWHREEPYPLPEFMGLLDGAVADNFYGFTHPLAMRQLRGEMTPDELRFLAVQEYPYYASTTWWNAMKLAQSDDLGQQRALAPALLDELGMDLVSKTGDPPHAELFLRYCEGLGLRRDQVQGAPIVPAVALAVTELRRISWERPAFEFIACSNLVVERMRPPHYTKLLGAFAEHYAWVPRPALRFYEVHAHLDDGHASTGRRLVESYVRSKRDQDAAFSAVLRSLCLRQVMYDGIWDAMAGRSRRALQPWPNFPREPWPRAHWGT